MFHVPPVTGEGLAPSPIRLRVLSLGERRGRSGMP